MKFGFVNISACAPSVQVADTAYNVAQIENEIIQAEGRGVEIILFPEMSITAYTCADLFHSQTIIEEAEMALINLMQFTRSLGIISIVGLPVEWRGTLLNCAAVLQKGRILGLVPKTYIPNYKEFYEQRWFHSGHGIDDMVWLCGSQVPVSPNIIFNAPSCRFAVEICEDLWAPVPPSTNLCLQGADIIFNLSADNDFAGKRHHLENLLKSTSSRCLCAYVYAAAGCGESTQDMVFMPKTMAYELGDRLSDPRPQAIMPASLRMDAQIDVERIRNARRQNTTFATAADKLTGDKARTVECELFTPRDCTITRAFPPQPLLPDGEQQRQTYFADTFNTQVCGLARRLRHTSAKTAVIGVSGGLDSTLALLVTAKAMQVLGHDTKAVVAVTMPGFGTTGRTYNNALKLMRLLGCTVREISIAKSVTQHFADIGHDAANHDTTYENAQARERTQILMDVANQTSGLVVGTGDLSELALGWAAYNGDHMSMYGVNASLPKTLIPHVLRWAAHNSGLPNGTLLASLLEDIIDTPISPELTPADEQGEIAQKTEDLVGPYELHDFFLYHTLINGFRPSKIEFMAANAFAGKHTPETIHHWATVFFKRFFTQQFKRSCLPDGPKATALSLSPRGDWRMPTDASPALWLAE